MQVKFKPWQEVEYDKVYAKEYESGIGVECPWFRDTYTVIQQLTNSSVLCLNQTTKKSRVIHKDFLVLVEEDDS